MPSTFFGLNIGKSGLYAYQASLDTTAHNIANAETSGYSRQVINQKASRALRVNSSYGMAGSGADVTGVSQVRSQYLDEKFNKNSTLYGNYSTKSYYMNTIESYFNEISVEGFTTNFNSMYDSLQELSKDPSSLSVRTQVSNYASNLTEYLNTLANSLSSVQKECNFEVKNQVDRINSLGQQIAAVTKQINTVEVGGVVANDLRDQRALLVDELSQIVDVSVSENIVGNDVGVTTYIVKINNQTLVDTTKVNTLKVVPREEKVNQNDAEGLYDIYWSSGQSFNVMSSSNGGSLKALFEVRDGNNNENLSGVGNGVRGSNTLTLTDTEINSVERLNIPETGIITVGDKEYKYLGFEVTTDNDGNFVYEFDLEAPLTKDITNVSTKIGDSVDYKGIPYYMGQMNEFIRTFSKAYNDICRNGVDLEGNSGIDFFTGVDPVSGEDFVFGPYKGSEDETPYDNSTFHSNTGSYYNSENKYSSYYRITIGNVSVSKEIASNPSAVVTTSDVDNGVENNDIVTKLINLKSDSSMFKQGDPASFLQTLVAEVGIDTDKATNFSENQEDVLKTIENQRLSVSGVDMDEEAMNLVRYQNAYNLSAKVITIMDEIYDRLINYMGA